MTVEITELADDPQSAALNAQIEAVKKKYEPRIAALQAEGQQLQDEAPNPEAVEAMINVDFEVTWKDQEIIIDLPRITVKNKRIVFNVPEVRMDIQRIVYDAPAVRMVPRVVGKYPQVHGFTVKWKKIITHVPETYMHRTEIKLDLPRVTMKRHEMIVGIPELSMGRVRWVVSLPQFKAIKVSAATDELQAKGRELQAEGEAIGLAMSAEINDLVTRMMQGVDGVPGMIEHARGSFETAITSIKSSIDTLGQKGIDPIKVPTDGGNVNFRKTLEEVMAARDQVMPALEKLVGAEPVQPMLEPVEALAA